MTGPEPHFAITDVNRVRRYHQRGRYDRATIFGILDRGLVAHVAFVHDGRPVVIPMAYGRDGDRLFLHGARKGRITTEAAGAPVSIGVTLLDGIVVARSLFDSSMNYRAVVIHGRAFEIEDDATRLDALRRIVDHTTPGRWDEVRPPSEQELKATTVLEVTIESASAKFREGDAGESIEAGSETVWCGVVPIVTTFGSPVPDATVPDAMPIPDSVRRLQDRGTEL
jgi:nitroimidazol reductase NimA-like FMN-containing flavoprotein (pyridoxamine 5'-phosphate oxidase superfamily)